MEADVEMSPLGGSDALGRGQRAIVAARQDHFHMRKAYGFQGDQMRDLQHDLFFVEIVYADATGIIAAVPSVYGDYSYGLADAPSIQETHYQKPTSDRAHRLTDHSSRVYYTVIPRAEGNQQNLSLF